MKLLTSLRTVPFWLALAVTGCSNYSSVSEKRPDYQSPSAAGQLIAVALKHPTDQPLAQIGRYLDAAALAANGLQANPDDARARADYNYAVARIFDVINESGLDPSKVALACPGASQQWSFSLKANTERRYDLSQFKVLSADRYRFKGRLVVEQAAKEGLGAPLVAVSKIDLTKIDPFAQGKQGYYGMTGVVEFKGRVAAATLLDPLSVETVTMDGRNYPLAANFTAPIALALAELKPRKKELDRLFKPDEYATQVRLARLQPYDPAKIPILCVHGLGDSQATWAPMIESLRSDPVIRANYQIWFYSYVSGYPYPISAAMLRKQMDAINAHHPDHKEIVVIGHSMGGMITRTLMTDSGMTLWNAIYDKPPGEMPFSAETRNMMTDALIFKSRPEISRVIFMSPSHRGADIATSFFGRMGSKLIGAPKALLNGDTSPLTMAKPNPTGIELKKMPNSIDFLNPANRFVKTLNSLPLINGVPYHSVLGDRGKGGNLSDTKPVSSDGIVPYWSSHLDGAQSEIIIPSGHWTNQHPQGIAEVNRILHLPLAKK